MAGGKGKMSGAVLNSAEDTGLEVIDLHNDSSFAERRLHVRDVATQIEGMHRLARAFVSNPDTILQELVNAAVDLCGADSAGISMEREDRTDENFYHWVATAGEYSGFLNATLPRYPSACGICLERGQPQIFRVTQRFFDLMGVDAPTVTDGLLLPWQVDETRGTIWIMAHGRTEAFDADDCRMMQVLANFAAMGVRQQRQQKILMEQASAAAAAAMANDLAHKINNPLQSLTNVVYLAAEAKSGGDAKALALDLSEHIQRLSLLVGKLLALPSGAGRSDSSLP
ncbi:GAF domain-containing protein [Edaphobacter paludis]|uniref:GAF domain-containing protein n=1 Tax=Edaphobacter paludis TaxID=3035702 RepID=A0AAU7D816_9BACT